LDDILASEAVFTGCAVKWIRLKTACNQFVIRYYLRGAMIPDIFEILERATSGEPITKSDWDLDRIALPVKALVKKYHLAWDPAVAVPADADLADRVFQAGLDLVSSAGVYCGSSGRIIALSRKELEAGLSGMPKEVVFGEGADARTARPRKIIDPTPPLAWGGNPGVPTPEELFLPMVMSWMQEPLLDLATCGSLTQVHGHEVHTGEAVEVAATRLELSLLREGLRRVGRPGMGLLAAQSSVSELGDLAVANPAYLRACDAHLIPMLNELTVDLHNLTRVVNALDYGMRNASLVCSMVGGLGGDAPGTAVVQVASFIAGNLVSGADYQILHPIHIRHVATSTRAVMWVEGMVEQAFARNAPCVIFSDIYPKSGAMTRELLYEVAANAVAITVSGGHLEGVGACDGAAPNCTGLEARWMAEVGRAVARQGIDLAQANVLISKLLERYEWVFKAPEGNPGVRFDRAYDVERLEPVAEWERMYAEVKAEVKSLGIDV
jgi:methylamine--corrinoid protein Co-methyltransferase